MGDELLALLERIAAAAERIADAVEVGADCDVEPRPKPRPKSAGPRQPRKRALVVEAFDPGQRDDRLVLYIGQAVDVIARLQRHPRMTDVYQRWDLIPAEARARIEPFVLVYEGEPDRVERALAAVHGMQGPREATDVALKAMMGGSLV